MAVLVTGASGFLGGRLVEMLVAAGEQVRVFARPTANLGRLSALPLDVVRGDFADPEALRRAVSGIGQIFHCAGCSTDWAAWSTFQQSNILAVQALLDSVRNSTSLRRFLHVSTSDVYGYPAAACDESAPTIDTGLPYNRSKRAGEELVWKAAGEWGLPVTVVRPASIYGPWGTAFTLNFANLLRRGTMAVIDGGRSRAGLAYVDNVAEAMIAAAASSNTVGRAYNLADGTDVTWRTYVDTLATALQASRVRLSLPSAVALRVARGMEFVHGPLRLPGRPLLTRHAVNILSRDQEYPTSRAQNDFGFAPRIGFEEGMRRSVDWLQQLR